MARALNPNQIQKTDRSFNRPIYLVHLLLAGLTLYFSDRCFSFNGHEYEDYLFDLSNFECEVINLSLGDNSPITLRFKNQPIMNKSTLIEFFDDWPPEKKYIEVYKLLWDPGETFGSDVSTKIFKGEMGQPYEICDPPIDFKIDVSSMLFGKKDSLPIDVIDLTDFPDADPDDIGKPRNIPIGSIKKLVCPWTVAGWLSTLTANLDAGATSVVVSDASGGPSLPFTSICDIEEIRVTNRVDNTLTITRGYGGTTAVGHNKGSEIYEKRSDFEVEVSQYPVASIGDVYVKRGSEEWLRVISGITKDDGGGTSRATIVLSDKIKFEEKTNQAVSTGSHPHSASTSGNVTKNCIPTGATGGTNPLDSIDANESSYAYINNQTLQITFTESDLGTVVKQYIWVYLTLAVTNVSVTCGGTGLGNLAAVLGWQRKTKTGGDWGDDIQLYHASGAQIGEVYKEVEYTPDVTVAAHAADGVALSGNSVANTVIGDLVACDVNGIYDDDEGTITGTPYALIERPDHVRKYILINLLGFLAGDINASFDTVGAAYMSIPGATYKFAFNLPDIAEKTGDLFGQMDLQSRTRMFEWAGQFYLVLRSTEVLASQMDFDKNNIKGNFLLGKSDVVDIKNSLIGHYLRDYSKSGSLGEKYQGVAKASSSPSIAKYGLQQDEIEFSCLGDSGDMAADVLAWLLGDRKELKKTVELNALWDAFKLEPFDIFTVIVQIAGWSGKKFSAVGISYQPESELIKIKGEQMRETITQSRLPTQDDFCDWTPNPGPYNFQNVAETYPDDYSTYNESPDISYPEDVFLINPFSIPGDAIDISVKIKIRCRAQIVNSDQMDVILRLNNMTVYHDIAGTFIPTDFTDYEVTISNNPATGLPWTPAEINGSGASGIRGCGYASMRWTGSTTNLKSVTLLNISVDYKA